MEHEYIDTHCHPQLKQYDEDREDVIHRAEDAKVGMVCVGIDLVSSQQAISLASHYENMWAAVGVHPNDVTDDFDITFYEALLSNPKVVAIGEVGLDYYRTKEDIKRARQREVAKQWIELASSRNLPLILHCRDPKESKGGSAYNDLLKLLMKHPPFKGVVHSYTGDWDTAEVFIDLGFHIGFNGIITFTKEYDEVIKNVPLDKMLLETDSPFLSPVPYRGKRNEPSYIVEVAAAIAKKRGTHISEISSKTLENTRQVFAL